MTALILQVGERGAGLRHPAYAVEVRIPARFSPDGRRMIATCGPGGWIGQAAILAERVGDVWVSRVRDELGHYHPLRVTAERIEGEWRRVRDGRIGVARGPVPPRRERRW